MTISLGQLDLEALKNYLKIVQGFRTVNDPAIDTENVDGVAAGLIAVAALVNDQLLKDDEGNYRRDVVNNALNLIRLDDFGGQSTISANEVLTYKEGESLKEVATRASQNTAEDMRQLRNEMYHLKTKMIRSGAVSFDQVYNGWIDPFIHYIEEDSMDGRFTKDSVPILNKSNFTDIIQMVEPIDDRYKDGQFAVLLSNGKAVYADSITNVYGDALTLGDGTVFIDAMPDTIQKSYGLYHKGQFVFANDSNEFLDIDNSVNMIYKDGPNRIKIMELNGDNKIMGFATTIEVPHELDENYLNAIGLSLRTIGKPEQIWCELYHWNADAVYDPNYMIAKSEFKNSDTITANWKTHRFYFRDTEIRLESGHKYLLLIKGMASGADNAWCIGGFEENCTDVVHLDTYTYEQDNVLLFPVAPNLHTNKIYDAFVALYTTETQEVVLNYSKYGAYTGTFELENAEARRVRISFNPNLNGFESNPERFNVKDFYEVNVIGLSSFGYETGELVKDKDGNEMIKEYSHTVISNNEVSANEYAYDFVFPNPVTKIEFQIMYHNPYDKGHGSLFSVVVSTDNAHIE